MKVVSRQLTVVFLNIMMHVRCIATTFFTCAVFASQFPSCSTGAGNGRVWGSLDLPSCGIETDDFDMDVDFFAADYFDNTLTIRLQRTGQTPTFTDGVTLVVRDVEAMSAAPTDQTHEIHVEPSWDSFKQSGHDAGTPVTTTASPVKVSLYLNETCPDNRLGFSDGAGTLTMESIYVPGKQKRIKGTFQLEFVDPRHWKSPEEFGPHAEIHGEFDFNYTRGKPAQPFP